MREILWLGDGIEGDDTDGHIDDLTRFVGERTVVTVVEEDESDTNHAPLQANLERLRGLTIDGKPLEIMTLPMPGEDCAGRSPFAGELREFLHRERERPAADLCRSRTTRQAVAILQRAFPTRRVVPIDCRELIWGLGAFHCLTQQQPEVG